MTVEDLFGSANAIDIAKLSDYEYLFEDDDAFSKFRALDVDGDGATDAAARSTRCQLLSASLLSCLGSLTFLGAVQ